MLKAQLHTFRTEFLHARGNPTEVKPVIFDYFHSLSSAQRALLFQVSTVLQLILIVPATTATSEQSFSALRRVKTYLRNTL